MAEINRCPTCNCELPAEAPAGLCPACLLKAGMTSDHVEPGTKANTKAFTPPTPAELAPHFPQLEILELVGQGGMGAVYKAKQVRLDRIVALKVLPKDAERGQEFADRFTREAKAMARLSHPNIIAIHDYGETGGWFYFVMEFVDGVNVRQAMKAEPIKPADALAIVMQICDALQYAHEESVVHRDIKPENILLTRKGKVKIADFGLAKLLGMSALDRHLTATQQVMGTIGYMAPEQMEGSKSIDHRADIYALGVVFYELLTGELPMGRFAPPSHKVQVDIRIDEVVLKSLEREPSRRYQSASQVKHEVERISAGPAVIAPSMSSDGANTSSSRLLVLGVSLLTLAVIEFAVGVATVFDFIDRNTVTRVAPVNPLADFGAAIDFMVPKVSGDGHGRRKQIVFVLIVMDFLVFSPVVMLAGMLILARRLWGIAIFGTYVALVPLAAIAVLIESTPRIVGNSDIIQPLGLIGIPFGIWGLIELNRPLVKSQFGWPLMPFLATVWRFLYPRILNSTLFTVGICTITLAFMLAQPWSTPTPRTSNHDERYFAAFVTSIVAVFATAVMIIFLVGTWTFTWKPVLWRPFITLFGGLVILAMGVNYAMLFPRDPREREYFNEGLYASFWAGGILCLNGAWRLACWFARERTAIASTELPMTIDEPACTDETYHRRSWWPWAVALLGIAVAIPATIWIADRTGLIQWQPLRELEQHGTFYVRPNEEAWIYFNEDYERPPAVSFRGIEAHTVQIKQCETYGFQWKSVGKSDFMDSGTISWAAKGRRSSAPRQKLPEKPKAELKSAEKSQLPFYGTWRLPDGSRTLKFRDDGTYDEWTASGKKTREFKVTMGGQLSLNVTGNDGAGANVFRECRVVVRGDELTIIEPDGTAQCFQRTSADPPENEHIQSGKFVVTPGLEGWVTFPQPFHGHPEVVLDNVGSSLTKVLGRSQLAFQWKNTDKDVSWKEMTISWTARSKAAARQSTILGTWKSEVGSWTIKFHENFTFDEWLLKEKQTNRYYMDVNKISLQRGDKLPQFEFTVTGDELTLIEIAGENRGYRLRRTNVDPPDDKKP